MHSQHDAAVVPESQPACEFATVVTELVPPRSRLTVAVLGCAAFVLKLSDWSAFLPNQRAAVRVLRRADGKELIRYDYVHMRAARSHAASLDRRMSSWDVSDLCAHLGLPRADVAAETPQA